MRSKISLRQLSRNCLRKSRARANSKRGNKTVRIRGMHFETLEDRRVLAVDWRNPVDSLDVTGDTFVVPLDVLFVINELNQRGGRPLPPQRDPALGFIDVNGDQNVSPIDALLIINAINNGLAASRLLTERSQLASESEVTITVGQPEGAREYRVQIEAAFDRTSQLGATEDLLNVYVVDQAAPSNTLLDRGTKGTSVFSLAGEKVELAAGLARWDGSVLSIDLTKLVARDTAQLKFQLIGSDDDRGSRVRIRPLSNQVSPNGIAGELLDTGNEDLASLVIRDASGLVAKNDVAPVVENIRYDPTLGTYEAELRLHNRGESIGRNAVVMFSSLPAGVSLVNPSGKLGNVPFLHLRNAIASGGLPSGATSGGVLFRIDDPTNTPFVLDLDVLADTNQPPAFDQLSPIVTTAGEVITLPLSAVDPNGDAVTFSVVGNAPFALLDANNQLHLTPAPTNVGSHRLEVIASDGVLEARQTFKIEVRQDLLTTTRIAGKVLKVDGQPIANMRVEIGSVQGLTGADGSFELDVGAGSLVADTLRVRGEIFPGPVVYPFIAEKLRLVLDHDVFPGVRNVISRPIFLPEIDVASGTRIDPAQDTIITTSKIPGAAVTVKAGTLMNQQGTPFTGILSITDVPVNLTPAALPENLFPGQVVTIQPGEMVFAQPAPLSLPNVGQMPPGTIMDLWSINPITGDFDNVGTGRVSTNGQRIDTISGGIRNSSWHFFVQPVTTIGTPQDPNQNQRNQESNSACRNCPPPNEHILLESTAKAASEVALHSGALLEHHQLVTYESLGQQRGFQLRYNSLHADPRPIIHFGIDNAGGSAANTGTIDLAMGRMSFTHNGVTEQVPGFTPAPGTFGLLPSGQHFWRLPIGLNNIDIALQAELKNKPTGLYDFELTFGIQRFTGLAVQTGALQTFNRQEIIVNKRFSPFGAGWDLTDLDEIIENENGSVMVVTGSGGETLYDPPETQGGPFVSGVGDFGTMEKISPDAYRYTDKIQNVTLFARQPGGKIKVASFTDRNGNRTSYQYDGADRIVKVIDPVGLETTFSYTNSKVSSITDPAGRVTRLVHQGENLVEIVDPDGSSRKFEYDSERRMVAETDKRGFREQEKYGFHGRVVQTIDKLGQIQNFEPAQVLGLFPIAKTTNRLNPPTAIIVPANVAESRHTEPNGNVIVTTMNEFGLEIAKRDAEGALPTRVLNEDQLPSVVTDARGNRTFLTYDDRGNNLTSTDEIAMQINVTNSIFPSPMLRFNATQMEEVALGDLDGDGDLDMVVTLSRGTTVTNASFDRNHVGIRLNNGDGTFGDTVEVDIGGAQARRPVAVQVRDINKDSRLDILTANTTSNTVSVLLGEGTGKFGAPATFKVGAFPSDLVVADFNNDGNLDWAASSSNFGVNVFLGDGKAGFTERTTIINVNSVAEIGAADFNGDRIADLVISGSSNSRDGSAPIRVFLGDGTGLFGNAAFTSELLHSANFALGDIDRDGDNDIVSSTDGSPITGVGGGFVEFINDGAANFTRRATGIAPFWNQIELADINQDTFIDVVATRGDGTLFIRPGNGDGTFGPFLQQLIGDTPEGLALGDIDGNGIVDAVTTHGSNGAVVVLQGQRSRFFYTNTYSASGPSPVQIVLADMNRDGTPDLVSANLRSSAQAISVALNIGGKFGQPFHQSLPREGRAVAVGDFNGDKMLDVANVSGFNAEVHISLGNGDGTLDPEVSLKLPSGARGIDLAIADLNRDGKLDIAVVTSANVAIFLGNGDGTFLDPVPITLTTNELEGGGFVSATDIDGDKDTDLLVANNNGNFRVLKNNGDGTFATPVVVTVASARSRLTTGDIDGDGDADVVVRLAGVGDTIVREISRAAVLKNRGDGTFDPAVTLTLGAVDCLASVGNGNH